MVEAFVGIDPGTYTSCLALSVSGKVDLVTDEHGKREIPSVVSYGHWQRTVGVNRPGSSRVNVTNVKQLLGKQSDDKFSRELSHGLGIPNSICKDTEGRYAVQIASSNAPLPLLAPEQVMASLLKYMKGIAESVWRSIYSTVLAVPVYFAEGERYAMLYSAQLAGLDSRQIHLMNDLAAAALAWVADNHQSLSANATRVAFLDVGHASTQVCIADITRSEIRVRAHQGNRSAGGRDLDAVLLEHFSQEFRRTKHVDIRKHPKARQRLAKEVNRLREMLTFRDRAQIDIEDLIENHDFRLALTLREFEQLIAPSLKQIHSTFLQALHCAHEVCPGHIHAVEMIGKASLTPAIESLAENVFQQAKKRTMKSKDCVARGCAIRAAQLSDPTSHPVTSVIDAVSTELFYMVAGSKVKHLMFSPRHKDTLLRCNATCGTFNLPNTACNVVVYESGEKHPIAEISVGSAMAGHPPKDAKHTQFALEARLDCNGLLDVMKANLTYTQYSPMDTKVTEMPLECSVKYFSHISRQRMEEWKEQELQMVNADKLHQDKERAHNALEGTILLIQGKLQDWAETLGNEMCAEIATAVDEDEMWLSAASADAALEEYEKRRLTLEAISESLDKVWRYRKKQHEQDEQCEEERMERQAEQKRIEDVYQKFRHSEHCRDPTQQPHDISALQQATPSHVAIDPAPAWSSPTPAAPHSSNPAMLSSAPQNALTEQRQAQDSQPFDDTFNLPHRSPPPPGAPLAEHKDFLEYQLDVSEGQEVLDGLVLQPGLASRVPGGQAIVQFAVDKRTKQAYAIKFFVARRAFEDEQALYLDNSSQLRRFLPQLRAIVDGRDSTVLDNQGHPFPPCIVMEKGESLDQWAKRNRGVNIFANMQVIHDIAERLQDMHDCGYVHRDLKPANIMWLPRENRWTLIDFGCAAQAGQQAPLEFSLAYASPEIIRALRAGKRTIVADKAMDAWALGILAVEVFSNSRALNVLKEGDAQVMSRILGDLPLPWERGSPHAEAVLKSLGRLRKAVLELLHRKPEKRTSMETFVEHCRKIFEQTTQIAHGDGAASYTNQSEQSSQNGFLGFLRKRRGGGAAR